MRRPARQFRTLLSELEGRWLLSTAPAVTHAASAYWQTSIDFADLNGGSPNRQPIQVATQQDGAAIVKLGRYERPYPSGYAKIWPPPTMPLQQVRVTTDPSSPAVGVNVAPVDQIVTFAPNEYDASLSVPILAGAPNPGEVDVALTLTPIDPPPHFSTTGPLDSRSARRRPRCPRRSSRRS